MQGIQIPTRLKLLILTASVLAGICLTGYVDYKSNQKIAASGALLHHTQQVIYEVVNIFSLAKDVQAATDNFVLTKDSAFLAPLSLDEIRVFQKIDALKELTKDNVSQMPRIDSLQCYVRQVLDLSHRTIAVRASEGLSEAAIVLVASEKKHYTDRIGQITRDIQEDETLLLNEERQLNEHSIAVLNSLSIVMFFLMLLFTLLLFIVSNTFLKQQERHTKEVAQWNTELVVANSALEAFSYSVSHDLRSPVRSIIGFSKIINEKHGQHLSDKVKELFSHIESSSRRMNAIIDDLLVLAKSGTKKLTAETVDISALVTQVWKNLHFSCPHHAVLELQQLPMVQADGSMLEQVIVNLLSNAIKYSGKNEKPVVTVGYEERNGRIIFFVRDNGAGFDMKHYDRLFGAFQRLHLPSDYEGIGIGLTLVKRIIERHGGEVWAEGKINEGATFYFSLA